MSQELFELYKTMNSQEIETKLALQCAPLLTGIKVSNLLNTDKKSVSYVKKLFKKSPISLHIIYESENKVTFLLYQKHRLESYLTQRDVRHFMHQLGYSSIFLPTVIEEFTNRYKAYKKGELNFPHEMGLLLGYPTEDVTGFMENNGKHYLHSGYWKIYSNPNETLRLFKHYSQAQEKLVRMIYEGWRISDIINLYYSKNSIAV